MQDVCAFDAANFRGSDTLDTQIGRNILQFRSALVLIPKQPLRPGSRYTVFVTNAGLMITWAFSVSPSVTPP